ncbi:LysR family transcriptional regulator [Alteromonadaceae bacterium M269]|nr:LysR family transcriptional regulator [Alteromonadaceae bacterium M269]
MDLRSLHYFTLVYEHGSVSAAARASYVAQPSISSSIKQLESELHCDLFKRHARGVIATESGDALYKQAKQLLSQAAAIKQKFSHQQQKIPFRLGLVKGLGVERITTILKRFMSSQENMELTLVPPEESADAKIINKELQQKNETFLPMWEEEYVLAIPASHKLALEKELVLEDLAELPFVQRITCDAWPIFEQQLNKSNIDIEVRAKTQTVEYAIGLVKAGLGCALLPKYPELLSQPDVEFRLLDEFTFKRQIGLCYSEYSDNIEALKKLAGIHWPN